MNKQQPSQIFPYHNLMIITHLFKLVKERKLAPIRLTFSTKANLTDRFEWQTWPCEKWSTDRTPYGFGLDEMTVSGPESSDESDTEAYHSSSDSSPQGIDLRYNQVSFA